MGGLEWWRSRCQGGAVAGVVTLCDIAGGIVSGMRVDAGSGRGGRFCGGEQPAVGN
jgi:hypothetical protein